MQTTTASTPALGGQVADDPTEPIAVDRPEVPQVPGLAGMGVPAVEATSRGDGSGTWEQDLLHRARAEDVLHWQFHHRPISAEKSRNAFTLARVPHAALSRSYATTPRPRSTGRRQLQSQTGEPDTFDTATADHEDAYPNGRTAERPSRVAPATADLEAGG